MIAAASAITRLHVKTVKTVNAIAA